MVFGLCRGAWPYKGPCTAGGKLAAEALRVLKKSIQHAGARKTRLGRRPPLNGTSPLAPPVDSPPGRIGISLTNPASFPTLDLL